MSSAESFINVHTLCNYLSARDEVKWRDDDYTALFMVKAIKGDSFRGYFDLDVGGKVVRFNQDNSAEFRAIAHTPLARLLISQFSNGGTIVPIPSSKTTNVACERFITYEIAKRMAADAGSNFDCKPLLLFKQEMPSSRKGGSRSPYYIESNYKLNGMTGRPVILFDDVLTLGGHLKAAYWKLTDAGMRVIGAVTFAKTVKDNSADAFGPFIDQLAVAKAATLWDSLIE